jgi:hypothetical protein
MECFTTDECITIESKLSVTHFAFGIIGFVLALGFYLIFFSKSEEAILKRLEDNKRKLDGEEKFNLISKGLNSFEKKVLGYSILLFYCTQNFFFERI